MNSALWAIKKMCDVGGRVFLVELLWLVISVIDLLHMECISSI